MTAPTGSVTITGTATQGQTLTASNDLADPDGITSLITYQWYSDGTLIAGATNSTYTLTQAVVGTALSVRALYTDTTGSQFVDSSATSLVQNLNDAPTGAVTITGTATQGQTLSGGQTLADLDGLGALSYQWKADGVAITGANISLYTLQRSDVGAVITLTVSYTDGYGASESVTSSATSAVAALNTLPTGTVTISGTATQGQTLTAANSLVDSDGIVTVISYQWKQNGVAIAGQTASTLLLGQSQVGKTISVTASYQDLLGNTDSVTSSSSASVANVNDLPTGSVSITGTAVQFQTLIASNTLADADGLGAISYLWKANGIAISGATGSTLVLGQAQVGKDITVTASYTDGFSAAESMTSSPTSIVADVNDAPIGLVTISGTPTQSQTLTATNNLSDADGLGSISYQWKSNGVSIAGAISDTFSLTQSQVGTNITVTASYTDLLGNLESVTSNPTTLVTNINDVVTGSVSIAGTATQLQTLTVSNTLADIDGIGTINYQWKANGIAIAGATSNTLTLAQAQVGKTITVTASYTDLLGAAESVTSSPTSVVVNVNDSPTGLVSIAGTATVGQTLTASHTLTDLDGLGTVTYQWKANGTNIPGATSSTLTLTSTQVGTLISVAASYTDTLGTAESVTSSATSAVTRVNTAPSGSVTITGTAAQGQVLTAGNTLVDTDGLGPISYQWKADGVAISGAIGNTLLLSQSEVGHAITVTANYTDLQGTAEAVTSSATAAVANINDAPVGNVSISGIPQQGQTLIAIDTLVDADGIGSLTYQWKANGVAIANATSATFVPEALQVGKALSVTVSYIDGFGTPESSTSGATSAVLVSNRAPIIAGVPTVAQHLTMGESIGLSNLLVSDPDGPTVSMTLILSATNGTFAQVSSPGTSIPALQVSGTAAAINAVLKNLNFTATSEGNCSIQVWLSDGQSGTPQTTATLSYVSASNTLPGLTQANGTAPVIGDGNGDGVVDTLQKSVSSILIAKTPTPGTSATAATSYTTLVVGSLAGKVDASLATEPSIHGLVQSDLFKNVPGSMIAPIGALGFTASVGGGGQSTSMSLYTDANSRVNGYWVQDSNGYWINLASAANGGNMTQEGGKLRLDFRVTDGGALDSDGLVNGVIVNTGIVGFLPLSLVGLAPTTKFAGF